MITGKKVGILSSAKRQLSFLSGRERSTVMNLVQRSGVVDLPKHILCECKGNKLPLCGGGKEKS